MKKYVCLAIAALLGVHIVEVSAQQTRADWYNSSFEEDSVYGVAVDKAYRFLKDKPLKKEPLIALIGLGMDVEHEDLSHAIWKNPSPERGDVNGWNFIGGRDGEMLVTTPSVADREYARLKDLYADLTYMGGEYWKLNNGQLELYTEAVDSAEFAYYDWLRQTLTSQIMNDHMGMNVAHFMYDYVARADKDLHERFPDKELTRGDHIKLIASEGYRRHRMDSLCAFNVDLWLSAWKRDDWKAITDYVLSGEGIKRAEERFAKAQSHLDVDLRRRVVGDDYLNLEDDKYGNDVLFSTGCMIDVIRASVAAGKRGNGLGADGIADFAKLMPLVAYPEKGEPYGKDLVLALRYAVDHGADIVVMAYQPRVTTLSDRKWMYEALLYAESKNVLVIFPAWETADDMDEGGYYPNRFMGEKELTNLMIVAPSDKNGVPTLASNYGAQQVDLYAPAVDILAATPGDMYQIVSGGGISAGTLAGVAALVKGYYPELTAGQLRSLLIETVTLRKEVEVEKTIHIQRGTAQELFLFEELCVSGGIVNAYNAVVAADKMLK